MDLKKLFSLRKISTNFILDVRLHINARETIIVHNGPSVVINYSTYFIFRVTLLFYLSAKITKSLYKAVH